MAVTGVKIKWTAADDRALRTEWERGTTLREIAKILGVSAWSIASRRDFLGLEPRPDVRSCDTRVEIIKIMQEAGRPMTRLDIAQAMQKSDTAPAPYLSRMLKVREVHIASWRLVRGNLTPEYALGDGVDAPKPGMDAHRDAMRKLMHTLRQQRMTAKEREQRKVFDDSLEHMTKIARQTAKRGPAGAFDLMLRQLGA